MKNLILAAALIIASVSMTYAQKQVTTSNISIDASIIQGLSISGPVGTLHFGSAAYHTIVEGGIATTDTNIALTTADGRAINFSVTGDGAQSIVLVYPTSVTLTGTNHGGTLTYVPSLGNNSSSSSNAGANPVANSGNFPLGGTVYNAKTAYVWIAGVLNGVLGATPDMYSGTMTVQVSYLNQ